jgi:NAD(P)-dependent dehydrogenase (short-subunit alcohol dehydrogenase family)
MLVVALDVGECRTSADAATAQAVGSERACQRELEPDGARGRRRAGAMFTSRQVTPDGVEQTFALNHLAPFLLTNLLLERLTASHARVVTTASDAHKGAVLDLDDLQSERGRFRPGRAYSRSKLCNVLFTRELQRRTGFAKNNGMLARIGATLAGPFLRSPETGARPLVWLALDPAAGELRGRYVDKGRPTQPTAQAQDDRLAKELWDRSEALTSPGPAQRHER